MQLHLKLIDGEQLDFNVPKTSVVIGRSSQCDVIVPHEGMSRKHCMIELKDGEYFVTDLGSINGVFIEDQKIKPGVPTPWPVFLNLSFGVVQSLQVETESTTITRIPGGLGQAPAASAAASTPASTTKTLELDTKKISRAGESSRPKSMPKAARKEESSGRPRLIIMGLLLLLGLLGVAYMQSQDQQDAPLTPEEMYE